MKEMFGYLMRFAGRFCSEDPLGTSLVRAPEWDMLRVMRSIGGEVF